MILKLQKFNKLDLYTKSKIKIDSCIKKQIDTIVNEILPNGLLLPIHKLK